MDDATVWQRKAEALERVVGEMMEEEHRLSNLLARKNGAGAAASDAPAPSAAELHWLVATDDADGLRALLGRGGAVRLLGSTDSHGRTALHRAAANARADLVSILLGHGAPVSRADARGQTALHVAGDSRVVALLAAARADPLARDASGASPLDLARADGRNVAARALERLAAEPTAGARVGAALELGAAEALGAGGEALVGAGLLLLSLHSVTPLGLDGAERGPSGPRADDGGGGGGGGWLRLGPRARPTGGGGALGAEGVAGARAGALHALLVWRGARVLTPSLASLRRSHGDGDGDGDCYRVSLAARPARARDAGGAADALDALEVWVVRGPPADAWDGSWTRPPPSAARAEPLPPDARGGALELGAGWRLLARGALDLRGLPALELRQAACTLAVVDGAHAQPPHGWRASLSAQWLPFEWPTHADEPPPAARDRDADGGGGGGGGGWLRDELGFPMAVPPQPPSASSTALSSLPAPPLGATAAAAHRGDGDDDDGDGDDGGGGGAGDGSDHGVGSGESDQTDPSDRLSASSAGVCAGWSGAQLWDAALCAPVGAHTRLRGCRRLFRTGHGGDEEEEEEDDDDDDRAEDARGAGGRAPSLRARLSSAVRAALGAAPPPARASRLPAIPQRHRAQLWWELSGAGTLRDAAPAGEYASLCARAERSRGVGSGLGLGSAARAQIELDLARTFPDHPLFRTTPSTSSSAPAARACPSLLGALRRVLRAYALRNASVGYSQALGALAGSLLLVVDEEGAFWLLCALCERVLPDYYSPRMSGLLADRDVLLQLLARRLPAVRAALDEAGPALPLTMVLARWLLPLFVHALRAPRDALRLWDAVFFEGPAALVAAAFSICAARADELCAAEPLMRVMVLSRPPRAREVLGGLFEPRAGKKTGLLRAALHARERAHARRLAAQLDELRAATRLRADQLARLVARLRARLHAGEGATELRVSVGGFVEVVRDEAPGCALPAALVHGLFDSDADGWLDVRELLVGLALLQRASAAELLRACFRAYDTDGSGFLERAELAALVARVYRFVLADGDSDGAAEAEGAAAVVTRDAFARFDANGDERLSFDEFAAIVQGDYLLTSWFQLQAATESTTEDAGA